MGNGRNPVAEPVVECHTGRGIEFGKYPHEIAIHLSQAGPPCVIENREIVWIRGIMKTVGRLLCSSAALAAACLFNTAFATAPHVKVSSNVALIPTAPGVTVDRLPKRKVHISWRRALHAAKREWGLETRQVEVVVRAVVSDEHIDVAGWAVVADLTTHNPAPGNTTVYNEMVIAVSGKSGKVVFSYPVDPVVPTAAPAAPPRIPAWPPKRTPTLPWARFFCGSSGRATSESTCGIPVTTRPQLWGLTIL